MTASDNAQELAQQLLDVLKDKGQTLAVAESCTGGLLGGALTAVPGSSSVFLGGVISYANHLKVEQLGVPEALITTHGAVSHQVVEAMARGVLNRLNADWALSVSGIAGPDGGTEDKPVGTVVIGAFGAKGGMVKAFHFDGDRTEVRHKAVEAALELGLRLVDLRN